MKTTICSCVISSAFQRETANGPIAPSRASVLLQLEYFTAVCLTVQEEEEEESDASFNNKLFMRHLLYKTRMGNRQEVA